MLQDVVISEVKQPTDWCTRLVVVPKRISKIRIWVDYTKLNTWVKREKHLLPHVDQVLVNCQAQGFSQNVMLRAASGKSSYQETHVC